MNKILIREATHQRDCHQKQVSGVWSIDAKEFCKRTSIPNLYSEAVAYQIEKELDDNMDFQLQEIDRYTTELGSLTDKQTIKIEKDCSDACINDEGYSSYFWDYVIKKLEEQE